MLSFAVILGSEVVMIVLSRPGSTPATDRPAMIIQKCNPRWDGAGACFPILQSSFIWRLRLGRLWKEVHGGILYRESRSYCLLLT